MLNAMSDSSTRPDDTRLIEEIRAAFRRVDLLVVSLEPMPGIERAALQNLRQRIAFDRQSLIALVQSR